MSGMRVRVHHSGGIEDLTDILCAMGRTNLRAMLRDPAFAREIFRRATDQSCCLLPGNPRNSKQIGCHCETGLQYKTDEDIQENYEGCAPDDTWSDGKSLLDFHAKMGRGPGDPLLGDCDDLSPLIAALTLLLNPTWRVWLCITRPPRGNVAHAHQIQDQRPLIGPIIEIPSIISRGVRINGPLWIFDGSSAHGMKPAPADFFLQGERVAQPLLREEL